MMTLGVWLPKRKSKDWSSDKLLAVTLFNAGQSGLPAAGTARIASAVKPSSNPEPAATGLTRMGLANPWERGQARSGSSTYTEG